MVHNKGKMMTYRGLHYRRKILQDSYFSSQANRMASNGVSDTFFIKLSVKTLNRRRIMTLALKREYVTRFFTFFLLKRFDLGSI